MIIQIKIFLYIYYGFLMIWFLLFLTSIYHMLKFGFRNITTLLSTAMFIGIAFLILSSSFLYIDEINWEREVEILDGVFNSGLNFNI